MAQRLVDAVVDGPADGVGLPLAQLATSVAMTRPRTARLGLGRVWDTRGPPMGRVG